MASVDRSAEKRKDDDRGGGRWTLLLLMASSDQGQGMVLKIQKLDYSVDLSKNGVVV